MSWGILGDLAEAEPRGFGDDKYMPQTPAAALNPDVLPKAPGGPQSSALTPHVENYAKSQSSSLFL